MARYFDNFRDRALATELASAFTRTGEHWGFNADDELEEITANDTPAFDGNRGLLFAGEPTTNLFSGGNTNTFGLNVDATISSTSEDGVEGTTNGVEITADSGTGQPSVTSGVTAAVVSATTYTYSVFAKEGTASELQIFSNSGTFGTTVWANFDLSNGTVGNMGAGVTRATMTAYADGWYRCQVTADATASAMNNQFFLMITEGDDPNSRVPSGSYAGTETLLLNHYQLEAQEFATPYFEVVSPDTNVRGQEQLEPDWVNDLGLTAVTNGQTAALVFVAPCAHDEAQITQTLFELKGDTNNFIRLIWRGAGNGDFRLRRFVGGVEAAVTTTPVAFSQGDKVLVVAHQDDSGGLELRVTTGGSSDTATNAAGTATDDFVTDIADLTLFNNDDQDSGSYLTIDAISFWDEALSSSDRASLTEDNVGAADDLGIAPPVPETCLEADFRTRNLPPALNAAFSRTGNQTGTTIAGTLETVVTDVPAFDGSRGLLFDGAAVTNIIPNSEQSGAYPGSPWTQSFVSGSASGQKIDATFGLESAWEFTYASGDRIILNTPVTVTSSTTYLVCMRIESMTATAPPPANNVYTALNNSGGSITRLNTPADAGVGGFLLGILVTGPAVTSINFRIGVGTSNSSVGSGGVMALSSVSLVETSLDKVSYVPTSGAAATQNASTLEGVNVADLGLRDDITTGISGAIFVRPCFSSSYTGAAADQSLMRLVASSDATVFADIRFDSADAGRLEFQVAHGGSSNTINISGLSYSAGDLLNIRFRLDETDGAELYVSVNGGADSSNTSTAGTFTSTAPAVLNRLAVGTNNAGGTVLECAVIPGLILCDYPQSSAAVQGITLDSLLADGGLLARNRRRRLRRAMPKTLRASRNPAARIKRHPRRR